MVGLPLLQEDDTIIELVAQYGTKRWTAIAEHLPGRIGKQCRERCARYLPMSKTCNLADFFFFKRLGSQGN